MTYNYDGTLIQAGNVHLKWTDKGQLAAIEDDGRRTSFSYGHDTRLDRALLADGTDVRYHYGNELMPIKITVHGATVAEYQWADKIRLLRYRDARRGLSYDFVYTDSRAPVRVIISGSAVDLYQTTGISAQRLELDIRTDQVDSIRALSLPDGRPVKYIEYDSFGNVISDSRPDWQFPLGFACGLHDHWTGLIRFGFRDYDCRFGRFTALDPIGDTGGDHDLWDYCVDDPVSSYDPSGLEDEKPDDEFSSFRKSFLWWTLPHNHPAYQKREESFLKSMRKELYETGGGFLDATHGYTSIPQGRLAPYFTPGPGNPGPAEDDWIKYNKNFIDRRNRDLGRSR